MKRNRRLIAPIALLAAMAIVALSATACSSPSPSASGAAGSSTTGTTAYQKGLAYVSCVRSHGVPDFPDPKSNGSVAINFNALHVSQSVLQAAENACSSLDPSGGTSTGAATSRVLSDALKYASCMRSHGVPNYPDPTVSGGVVTFSIPLSLNPQSPQFLAAKTDCLKYKTAGSSGTGS